MRQADRAAPAVAGEAGKRIVLGRPNGVRHLSDLLAALRPLAWCLARTMHHLDRAILRVTGGRRTAAELLTGLPVIALTTTGARSGQTRTLPLIGIPDGERIVVVGTNFGRRHHPAWYHNLRANPEALIAYHGLSAPYLAREAEGEERERLWHEVTRHFPGYAAYLGRVGDRRVPIVILTPRDNW